MPPIYNDDAPVLDRVTDCDALVVPTFTGPNDRLAAESDATGNKSVGDS